MKFTIPCFVWVENPQELIEIKGWLKKRGYCGILQADKKLGHYIVAFHGLYLVTDRIELYEHHNHIDCGHDLELFRALAAMNDKNDREQWFTDGENWTLCETTSFASWVCSPHGFHLRRCHKATATEVINHFDSRKA